MKRKYLFIPLLLILIILSGFSLKNDVFYVEDLKNTIKTYKNRDIEACAIGRVKTYMDYRSITSKVSAQYKFIRDHMEVDENTGFLLDEDGFIGVALGSYFGDIGSRFYFTLDSGIVLPLVKVEEKADIHTDSIGCAQKYDKSVIEFVIDKDIANSYYGYFGNGLVLQGNFSNYSIYNGEIVKIEEVLDEHKENYVVFDLNDIENDLSDSIFNYGSGY